MLITELPKKASYSPGYFSKPTQLNDETYLLWQYYGYITYSHWL